VSIVQSLQGVAIKSPSQFPKSIRTAAIIVAAPLILVGCANQGVVISERDHDVQRCTDVASPIDVGDLAHIARDRCNLADEMVQFPDGFQLEIPKIGISGGTTTAPNSGPKDDYTFTNLGGAGVVVSHKHGSGKRHWWGPSTAVEKVKSSCNCG